LLDGDRSLIPIKQIHLIKTMLLNLEWQRKVSRTLEQQIAGRLLAGAQAFAAERINRFGV